MYNINAYTVTCKRPLHNPNHLRNQVRRAYHETAATIEGARIIKDYFLARGYTDIHIVSRTGKTVHLG